MNGSELEEIVRREYVVRGMNNEMSFPLFLHFGTG